MNDSDYFLFTCEKIWKLSEEGTTLLARATEAKDTGDEHAVDEIADRIDLNHVKRRLLLSRAQDMAQACAG
jgi:hypothetical protein